MTDGGAVPALRDEAETADVARVDRPDPWLVSIGLAATAGRAGWTAARLLAAPPRWLGRRLATTAVEVDRRTIGVLPQLEALGAHVVHETAEQAGRTVSSTADTVAVAAVSTLDLDRVLTSALDGLSPDALSGLVGQVVTTIDPDQLMDLVGGVMAALPAEALAPIVASVIDEIPAESLGPLVSTVIGQLPTEALGPLVTDVVRALDLVQLVDVVLETTDVEALTAAVLGRVDVEAAVANGLDEVDLQQLTLAVIGRLDLGPVVDAALDTVDVAEIVRTQGLSDLVLAETGGMAVDTLGFVRDQAASGDELVTRVVNRILRRRGERAETPTVLAAPLELDAGSGGRDR